MPQSFEASGRGAAAGVTTLSTEEVGSRRGSEPDTVEVRQPTPAEVDRDIMLLRRRIADIRQLQIDGVRWDDGKKKAVERHTRSTVREVFGPDSPEFREFKHFEIDEGPWNTTWTDDEYQEQFLKRIPHSLAQLEGLVVQLIERKESEVGEVALSQAFSSAPSRRVFVVHGHEDGTKEATARFLHRLGLDPVILHEQADEGRTVIEKFEKYADVSFAVVLFTPDDLGYSKRASPDAAQPRARQNVVFELGFFIGKLGRHRVCVLRKGDTEILSDYQGVLFVPIDSGGHGNSSLLARSRQLGSRWTSTRSSDRKGLLRIVALPEPDADHTKVVPIPLGADRRHCAEPACARFTTPGPPRPAHAACLRGPDWYSSSSPSCNRSVRNPLRGFSGCVSQSFLMVRAVQSPG